MRKRLSIALALIFLFTSILPAFAGEVRSFGFDDYRHRENTVSGTRFYPAYYHNGGQSFSQPLILSGSKWGFGGKVIITVEGNVLNGYKIPDTLPANFSPITPTWSVQLDGSTPTTSHPTLVEKNGKRYIYIGTYSQYLDIVDITNFDSVNQGSLISRPSPLATDITSAPLVLNWKGHEIVVSTTGDSGKMFIVTDPLDNSKNNDFYINVGSGRTSSSPAPVAGGAAFAVGLDGGFQQHGELRIYYLDDILSEDGSGKVVKGSETTRVAKSLPSGLVASFAMDGDMLYFGDSNSNVYGINVATQTGWVNTGNAGTFSNRSPALTPSRVYFPITNYGSPDAQGQLVAIDRSDGATAFALPMQYNDNNLGRTMTAPVVMRAPGNQAQIVVGTGLGYVAFIDPSEGSMVGAYTITGVTGDNTYASGVTGEISTWDNLGISTSEQGVIIWQLKPYVNLKVTDISLNPSPGSPGQATSGTITVKNESGQDYKGENVVWKVRHSDGSDLVGNTIITDLAAGESKTLPFSFIPDVAGTYSVAAMINPNHDNPPNEDNFVKGNWPGDNRLEVPYTVQGKDYDIKVQILQGNPYGSYTLSTSDNPAKMFVNVAVTRKDNLPGSLPVHLTITGGDQSVDQNITLDPGGNYVYQIYRTTATQSGSYTIQAQAWPSDSSWTDSYPQDNTDSMTLQYIYTPPPAPQDNRLHGELIGTE